MKFDKVLHRNNWGASTHMMPSLSYAGPNNIYFIPEQSGGFFVEWKGKGNKPIVVCETCYGNDCLKKILEYSNNTYDQWLDYLISEKDYQIKVLLEERKELEKQLENEIK